MKAIIPFLIRTGCQLMIFSKLFYFITRIANNITINRCTIIHFYFLNTFRSFIFSCANLINIVTYLYNWIFICRVSSSFGSLKFKNC